MNAPPGTLPHASAGAGEPPLVFVHGFGGSPGEWHAQLSHFAPRHLTIAVDLNGSIAARIRVIWGTDDAASRRCLMPVPLAQP